MNKYPLKLTYIDKTAIWGGSYLKEEYNKTSSYDRLAETWELSVREKDTSIIENGEYAGMTLMQYISESLEQGYDAVGNEGGRFPLLIKFIDAHDKLSVQVHPSDDYALREENDLGKTEMWYILKARDGAELIYGLLPGEDGKSLSDAISEGRTEDVLRHVPVKAGDCYFIPAGMPHAIGAGIVILEIQQNSDVTYRLYDYDRKDSSGHGRELHIKKALDVVKNFSDQECLEIRQGASDPSDPPDTLVHCRYFYVRHIDCKDKVSICSKSSGFLSIIAIEGRGEIHACGMVCPLNKGDSYFIPAGLGQLELQGNVEVVVSGI